MMLVIPIQAVPTQSVKATLNDQDCQIDIRQRRTGVFVDLYVNEKLVVAGCIGQDRNPMVRSAYLGFVGDIAFFDNQGTSDPNYEGFGTRFLLGYFPPGDAVA